MSLSTALSEGLSVTVTGLLIVFSVLIILMLVMMLMKVVFYHPEKEQTAPAQAPAPKAAPTAAQKPAAVNDEELIAVLTAAVAASLNTSTYHLNIKSYKRIESAAPAWNKAGLRDVIDARF